MVLAELGSKVAIALRKMTQATVVGTRAWHWQNLPH